jgi:hypothetical protein
MFIRLLSTGFRLARPALWSACIEACWADCARASMDVLGWWDFSQRRLPVRGESPARRDGWDILPNVVGATTLYILPVDGSAEKKMARGANRVPFRPSRVPFWHVHGYCDGPM